MYGTGSNGDNTSPNKKKQKRRTEHTGLSKLLQKRKKNQTRNCKLHATNGLRNGREIFVHGAEERTQNMFATREAEQRPKKEKIVTP